MTIISLELHASYLYDDAGDLDGDQGGDNYNILVHTTSFHSKTSCLSNTELSILCTLPLLKVIYITMQP